LRTPTIVAWDLGALCRSAAGGKKSMSVQALDELKQQIPLLDYLQAQDWQPTRQLSRGRWMGLCPLHCDRKPSFLVDSSKSLFYCYGCGRSGDVIRFAQVSPGEDFRYPCRSTTQLTVLNCRFLIFSANSIPLIVTAAAAKLFRSARSCCSDTCWIAPGTRFGNSPPSFNSVTAQARQRIGFLHSLSTTRH